jgi:hypothetical protein
VTILINFILGIIFTTIAYPLLVGITELIQVVFEKWKYQIMIKITKIKSEIIKITDEQSGEIVHNVIGF